MFNNASSLAARPKLSAHLEAIALAALRDIESTDRDSFRQMMSRISREIIDASPQSSFGNESPLNEGSARASNIETVKSLRRIHEKMLTSTRPLSAPEPSNQFARRDLLSASHDFSSGKGGLF